MQIRSQLFIPILIFGILFLTTTVLFFSYVFFLASWVFAWKLASLLGYVVFVLVMVVSYQMRMSSNLRREMSAAGLGEERTFADLYQNSPVPYVRTDKQGMILHVNAAAVRLFNHTVDELTQRTLFELLHEVVLDGETHLVTLEHNIRTGQFVNEVEVEIPFASGSPRWALLSAFPYKGNAERLVTIIDITEQKKVDQAKTEFVSLASHQLRTPIAAMLWNLELLSAKSSELTKTQYEYISKVERSVRRMKSLVSDFLDATKLEMGTFATKPSPVAVNALLQSICGEFEAQVIKKNLVLQVDPLPAEVVLNSDERLLHMIFSNLISNAVKYTPDQGKVTVHIERTEAVLQLRVRDTGIGVPVADQPLLFTKLYRASNTKTSDTEGTGLGLYVVKQAVEILEGEITFTSTENEGTEFLVTIPYQI